MVDGHLFMELQWMVTLTLVILCVCKSKRIYKNICMEHLYGDSQFWRVCNTSMNRESLHKTHKYSLWFALTDATHRHIVPNIYYSEMTWSTSFTYHFPGHKDVVEFLIESGADINCQNDERWTYIHTAVIRGNIDHLLLEKTFFNRSSSILLN